MMNYLLVRNYYIKSNENINIILLIVILHFEKRNFTFVMLSYLNINYCTN